MIAAPEMFWIVRPPSVHNSTLVTEKNVLFVHSPAHQQRKTARQDFAAVSMDTSTATSAPNQATVVSGRSATKMATQTARARCVSSPTPTPSTRSAPNPVMAHNLAPTAIPAIYPRKFASLRRVKRRSAILVLAHKNVSSGHVSQTPLGSNSVHNNVPKTNNAQVVTSAATSNLHSSTVSLSKKETKRLVKPVLTVLATAKPTSVSRTSSKTAPSAPNRVTTRSLVRLPTSVQRSQTQNPTAPPKITKPHNHQPFRRLL